METKSVPTYRVTIFMAGDIAVGRQVCREECLREGLCVTIRECDYVFTGGMESGFEIGLLNYPRFPSSLDYIRSRAFKLADKLLERCCQHSYLIVDHETTDWVSKWEEQNGGRVRP